MFGDGKQPQKVSADFVRTLNIAGALDFPTLQDLGAQAGSQANNRGPPSPVLEGGPRAGGKPFPGSSTQKFHRAEGRGQGRLRLHGADVAAQPFHQRRVRGHGPGSR